MFPAVCFFILAIKGGNGETIENHQPLKQMSVEEFEGIIF